MAQKKRFFLHKKKSFTAATLIAYGLILLCSCEVPENVKIPPVELPTGNSSGSNTSGKDTSANITVETKIDSVASESCKERFGGLTMPTAPGTEVQGNDKIQIDTSNISDGYFYVHYLSNNPKVKLQVKGPDEVIYTYNLKNDPVYIPLSAGNGSYTFTLYENIEAKRYATAYNGGATVTLKNEFAPYLYPNMYVNFTDQSKAVAMSDTLTKDATCDLDKVTMIYDYIINTVVYDEEEAKTVTYDYLPEVDEVLDTQKGICFDYAALMACMLRSQSIPTKLQVGYAGESYHAWISTYVDDVGWIDGIIQFHDGEWTLMDPTFAANGKNSDRIKKFIGDGTNYNVLYSY